MKVVFMGAPEFGAGCLRALAASPHEAALVITPPDRPRGRGRTPAPPAMKRVADALGLLVWQCDNVNAPAALDRLAALRPDVIVVVAFGQILSREILSLPPLGCVNVHASLLPRHRGASPIQAAILAGDEETGVTVQQMTEALDAGDILTAARVPIRPDDTAGTLHDRLAAAAPEPLLDALAGLEDGSLVPRPQDESQATYCSKLTKDSGRIDWTRPAKYLDRFVRAMTPWPGASTALHMAARPQPMRVLVRKARVGEASEGEAEPGVVLRADKSGLLVACGEGALRLLELQQAGKKTLPAEEFLRGRPVRPGDRFGA